MGTAASKHFHSSASCFVTCGVVTKGRRHLQPLVCISQRGEEETWFTGWEICMTREQFCRNFPWNFTCISSPCLGSCQWCSILQENASLLGLLLFRCCYLLISLALGFVVFFFFFPDALLSGGSSEAKGFPSHAVYKSLASFGRTDFPGWCSTHTEECYYFYISFPSCKGTCLLISPAGEEHNSLSHFSFLNYQHIPVGLRGLFLCLAQCLESESFKEA